MTTRMPIQPVAGAGAGEDARLLFRKGLAGTRALAVGSGSLVSLGQALGGRMAVERAVRALGVVVGQEGGEGGVSFGAGGVGPVVGPAGQQGPDEALGLAVGARAVGAREEVADAERLARAA